MPDSEFQSPRFLALKSRFVRVPNSVISETWLQQKYLMNQKNVARTKSCIENDVEMFKEIEKLHKRRKTEVLDVEEKKALENQINELVERKNVPLNIFFTLPPHLLVVDLHGFLIGGAVRYVNKIAAEMMKMSDSREVVLITGHANTRCDKDPLIKINLLQKFPQKIRVDPNNGSRLIFTGKSDVQK
ncbi:hypothetical protein L5515_009236 [Caenorhabditis briggsae]|uniref:Smr domain-containing protein n=1 Tax=Caenorhabditis briggsae TaxID=6238 RepID=A0AAE9F9S7_CAEBR|nr:hypothetical protein L5515_009236 [Caenorhabditis briggsae]